LFLGEQKEVAVIEDVRPELKKRLLGYIVPFAFGKMIHDEFWE